MDFFSFKDLMTKSGIYALPLTMFLLLLNYWGIITISKIPIPYLVDGMYIYSAMNGAAATPFIYLERKAKLAHGKICPYCDSVLISSTKYTCPKCGDIKVENK